MTSAGASHPYESSADTDIDAVHACMSPAARGAAWFVVGASLLEAIVFYGLAQTVSKRFRSFHLMAYVTMLIPAVSYLSLVCGWGLTVYGAPDGKRCFFTGRWLGLIVLLPLLVATLGLLVGAATFDFTIISIASALAMTCGLLGGIEEGNNRWILFALAALFILPVLRQLWNRFYAFDADVEAGEYAGLVATKANLLASTLAIYVAAHILFWILCQGANVMRSSAEIFTLAIIDFIFISAANIILLQNRESLEKMSEYSARGMGWMRSGGSSGEYASFGERQTAALHGTH